MKKKILVVNGASYALAVDGLAEVTSRVSEFMDNPDDFSLVLFTGGEDVSPFLYHDNSPKSYCHFSVERDLYEQTIFEHARDNGVLMTGICRGLQFLNVMCGGRMMHHLVGHSGQHHEMKTLNGDYIYVNSYHHQMVLPPEDAIIVGWSAIKRSSYYIGRDDKDEEYSGEENECVIFPEAKAFGVQYHPEMMERTSAGYIFYYNMVRSALDNSWEDFVSKYTTGEKHAEVSA